MSLRVCKAGGEPLVRSLKGKTGKLRSAEFRGASYMVVPVVALVEGVVRPANSEGPELVLASEFGHQPGGWNYRPAMMGHPQKDGKFVSAGAPDIIEASSVGHIFNAAMQEKELHVEGWIDEARANELGGDAKDLVRRLKAGETVEVSVGVFLDLEAKKGTHGNQEYEVVWRNVVPDHIAFLKEGDLGACSIQMGCGAQRAAQSPLRKVLSSFAALFSPAARIDEENRADYEAALDAASTLGLRAAITDVDLRGALDIALRDAEPGFLGILAVDEGKTVIYHAFADGGGGIRMYARSFKRRDSKITLSDDKAEVRAETSFISVNSGTPLRAACGCGHQPAATAATSGDAAMNKDQLIAALIASKKNGYTEADTAVLQAMAEETLKRLHAAEAAIAEPTAAAAPASPAAPTAAQAPSQPTVLTEDAYLAQAPQSIRDIVARDKAARAAKKAELVGRLKTAQQVYKEDQLNGMEVERLEEISALVGSSATVDYGVLGMPVVAQSDDASDPPDSWGLKKKPEATVQ